MNVFPSTILYEETSIVKPFFGNCRNPPNLCILKRSICKRCLKSKVIYSHCLNPLFVQVNMRKRSIYL